MKLGSLVYKIVPYKIPFFLFQVYNNQKFKSYRYKQGYFIEWIFNQTLLVSEISPYPTASFKQLQKYKVVFKEAFEYHYSQNYTSIYDILNITWSSIMPEVSFTIEHLLLQKLAIEKKITLLKLLTTNDFMMPKINHVLIGSNQMMNKQLQALLDKKENIICLKVKIDNLHLNQQIKFINQLLKKMPKISIRLDANQQLKNIELLQLITLKERIDYLEEPFPINTNSISQIKDFYSITNIPIMLDESIDDLSEVHLTSILKLKEIAGLIIKPTRLGSLQKVLYYKKIADRNKKQLIFTSCFETSRMLSYLLVLSQVYQGNNLPCGLGTHTFLKEH